MSKKRSPAEGAGRAASPRWPAPAGTRRRHWAGPATGAGDSPAIGGLRARERDAVHRRHRLRQQGELSQRLDAGLLEASRLVAAHPGDQAQVIGLRAERAAVPVPAADAAVIDRRRDGRPAGMASADPGMDGLRNRASRCGSRRGSRRAGACRCDARSRPAPRASGRASDPGPRATSSEYTHIWRRALPLVRRASLVSTTS